MFATVVAVMCHLVGSQVRLAPDGDCTDEEARIEEIVTSSDLDPEHVDLFTCHIHGQIGVADWKSHHPIYFKDAWRVARVKCVPGSYVIKSRV